MTKKPLTVINGTGGKQAPPPTRRGLMRAIYETVDALGGANKRQIKKYLPAAIDDITGIVQRKKLDRAIYSCVYDGYLIHNPQNDRYYVAPISYYNSRREWLKQCQERSRPGAHPNQGKSESLCDDHAPPWHSYAYRVMFGLSVGMAFTAGIVVGLMIGGS